MSQVMKPHRNMLMETERKCSLLTSHRNDACNCMGTIVRKSRAEDNVYPSKPSFVCSCQLQQCLVKTLEAEILAVTL